MQKRVYDYRRRVQYGATGETLALFDAATHCEICAVPFANAVGKKLTSASKVYDHDHATGNYRGALCNACNRFLGLLGDSVERCQAIIAYLERQA